MRFDYEDFGLQKQDLGRLFPNIEFSGHDLFAEINLFSKREMPDTGDDTKFDAASLAVSRLLLQRFKDSLGCACFTSVADVLMDSLGFDKDVERREIGTTIGIPIRRNPVRRDIVNAGFLRHHHFVRSLHPNRPSRASHLDGRGNGSVRICRARR